MRINSTRHKLKNSLFSGIGRKFILYFIFFALAPIVVISVIGFKISEKIVIENNYHYLELQNELVENRLHYFFRNAEYEISPKNPSNNKFYEWLIHGRSVKTESKMRDVRQLEAFMKEINNENRIFSGLAMANNNGKITVSTSPFFSQMPAAEIKKMISTINIPIVYRSAVDSLPSIAIAFMIDERRNNSGFILAQIDNLQLLKILQNYSSKKQPSEIAIFGPNEEVIAATHIFPGFENKPNLQTRSQGQFHVPNTQYVFLFKSSSLSQFGWFVVSGVPYDTAVADLIVFRNQAIFGVGALLILLFGLAFYASQRLTVPIRQLVYSAEDIGDGLLDAPIKINSSDEIGLLAEELNKMRLSLLDYYENLEMKVQARTEELQKAQYQIMHQEKMASIGLLAAGIAHEIGNPLTSISSLTQLLKRRLKDSENLEYLSTIMKNIDRISKIVRELVDFSRPSNYEAKQTDINEVVQAAAGIVKYDSRAKYINWHITLDHSLSRLTLVADQLLQVFINILFNAVDAMEGAGNELSIKTYGDEQYVYIEIRDSGGGIPESEINKIFEPFYTTKEVGKGTGLGLSVSYGIVRNFSGKIIVESQEGRGSTFTIKLPYRSTKQKEDK